jgi:hypothetical protein
MMCVEIKHIVAIVSSKHASKQAHKQASKQRSMPVCVLHSAGPAMMVVMGLKGGMTTGSSSSMEAGSSNSTAASSNSPAGTKTAGSSRGVLGAGAQHPSHQQTVSHSFALGQKTEPVGLLHFMALQPVTLNYA